MLRKMLALVMTVGVAAVLLVKDFTPSAATDNVVVAQKEGGKKKRDGEGRKNAAESRQAAAPNADLIAGFLQTARDAGVAVLSNGDSYDDFASLAQTSDGTLYAAYAAYYDGHDQIRIHRQLDAGRWSTRSYVPLVQARADIWMPQLAVDGKDRVWVIWCEQTGQTAEQSGNWDLYARPLVGDSWGPIVRLTDDPKPDINPHVASDAQGNIHVVWQAHPQNNGDIQYCRFDGNQWSRPLAVTSDPESDWYPRVAVDKSGAAWIAFDSYRNGDYDVFLTSVSSNEPGKIIPIAESAFYEAHADVACAPDGKVWVSWEQGGHNWGKDQGYWLREQNRDQGTSLGSTRRVQVACYADGKVLGAPDVTASLPEEGRQQSTAMAELKTSRDGHLWLRFRHVVAGTRRPNGTFSRGWTENITYLTKSGWMPATELAASTGRISVVSRMLPDRDGSIWIAYSSDARTSDNLHRPIQDQVLVSHIAPPANAPEQPELKPYEPPEPPAAIPRWNSSREEVQVAAIREHRATIDGKAQGIVRGDLHRHTEMSWDVGPGNDGSYLDFYRYMIDVASMDFGSLTDHQGGGHYAYWWWLTEKSADMYYLAPRFVPLYGYERSARFPNGHRNIFHASRGVPVFPFQLKLDQTGIFPGIGSDALLDNDTKLLYEYLHASGGVAISHTSGSSAMGTDWRDNDPKIEPVVEIYQGARNSYETLGGPRVHPEDKPADKAPGGFQKAGLVWNAYQKGYRLGTISSSDHGSTHISYALVYTPENDRQSILDAIRKRHTYGATDNLIIEFRANGHFMGDEFSTREKPKLTLHAIGTSRVVQMDLIRNNQYIFTSKPDKATVEFEYVDNEPTVGNNLYYFRLLQEDGEVAWSSPIWVNYEQ